MIHARDPSGLEIVVDPHRVEASLWRRFRFEDDARCRETLFNRYFALARTLSGRLFRQRAAQAVDRGDFDQFACEGLLHAIDRYDPLRGVPFSAFARRRIIGNVADGMARLSEIGAQSSHRHRIEQERLRSIARNDPEDDALAMLSELAVGIALGLMLEGTGLVGNDRSPDPRPSAYDSIAWRETQAMLVREVGRLPETEGAVIRQHYDHGLPFAQVARLLGVSRSRVSQLHRSALDRLRKRLRSNG